MDGFCRPESDDLLVTVGRTIKKLLFTTYCNIYDEKGRSAVWHMTLSDGYNGSGWHFRP